MNTLHIFGASGLIGNSLKRLCDIKNIPNVTYSSSNKKGIDVSVDIRFEKNFINLNNISSNDVIVNLAAIANLLFLDIRSYRRSECKGCSNILKWQKKNANCIYVISRSF